MLGKEKAAGGGCKSPPCGLVTAKTLAQAWCESHPGVGLFCADYTYPAIVAVIRLSLAGMDFLVVAEAERTSPVSQRERTN